MSEVNGKPIRDRGGANFRPSRKAFHPPETHGRSVTALVVEAGAYSENSENVEVAPELVGATAALNPKVPALRQSLTKRQHLKLTDQVMEFERLKDTKRIQFDTRTKTMIETSDPNYRVSYRSDRTLLKRGNPFSMPADIKRQTSRTKRIVPDDKELPATVEVPTHILRLFYPDNVLVEHELHESKLLETIEAIETEWQNKPDRFEVVKIES